MKAKYIRFDNGLSDFIVCFPEFIEHTAVNAPGDIVSAGFICFDDETNEYVCYGESIGLKAKSDPMDSRFANKQLPKPSHFVASPVLSA